MHMILKIHIKQIYMWVFEKNEVYVCVLSLFLVFVC